MRRSFEGSLTALATPFDGGRVDFTSLRRLVEFQIESGTDGLVVAGSTGEGATLSTVERVAVIEFACGIAAGRIPVIAGVGTSDTRASRELARAAARVGADGLLVSTPPYSKPGQRGLLSHFGAIAESCALPLVLYNIPSRTGVDLLPETVVELARRHDTIGTIKEAGTSLQRVQELVAADAVDVLLGEDAWIADGLQMGARGVVGVVSNVVPGPVAQLVHRLLAGDLSDAPARVERIAPLTTALFLESNPAPLKAALEWMGLCSGELRLPLVPVTEETRTRVVRALGHAGITRG